MKETRYEKLEDSVEKNRSIFERYNSADVFLSIGTLGGLIYAVS